MPRTLLFTRGVDSVLFLAAAAAAVTVCVLAVDTRLLVWGRQNGWTDMGAPVWSYITLLGDSAYHFVGLGAFAVLYALANRVSPGLSGRLNLDRHVPRLVFILAAIIGTGLLANLLKIVFARPRPSIYFRDGSTALNWFSLAFSSRTTSLPSGHAATIWAVALAVHLMYRVPAWPLVTVASVVTVSRMALERHYLGDSLAGTAIGLFGTSLIFAAWQRFVPSGPRWLRAAGGTNR